jgi:hypothetical protein
MKYQGRRRGHALELPDRLLRGLRFDILMTVTMKNLITLFYRL